MMTTTHAYRGFVFTINYRVEEPGYIVRFTDIPEIVTSGGSLIEAFAHACAALDLHLESLEKLGMPLPIPRHRLVLEAV
jgi:predicted RNase H-like HicB family nuclease